MPGNLGFTLLLPFAESALRLLQQLLTFAGLLAFRDVCIAQRTDFFAQASNFVLQTVLGRGQFLQLRCPFPALFLAAAHSALQAFLLLVRIADFIPGLGHQIHQLQECTLQLLFLALVNASGYAFQPGLLICKLCPQLFKSLPGLLQLMLQLCKLTLPAFGTFAHRSKGGQQLLPVALQIASAFLQQLTVAFAFLISFTITQQLLLQLLYFFFQ
ncbi:hypothetical protein D3C73_760800 [compost metagenome]